MTFRAQLTSLRKDRSGIAALEFAILAPIILILLLGAIEYGWYFIKSEVVTRAVSNISDSIQRNPTDPTLQTLASNSGLSAVSFNQSPNFICAQSFASLADATAANNASGVCNSGWNTAAPTSGTEDNGTAYKAGDAYYVGVKGFITYKALTPVMQFVSNYSTHSSNTNNSNTSSHPTLPGIQSSNIFKVGGSTSTSTGLPSCTAGQILQSNGTGFVCVTIPVCTSGQSLQFNGSTYTCVANTLNPSACHTVSTGSCASTEYTLASYCASSGLSLTESTTGRVYNPCVNADTGCAVDSVPGPYGVITLTAASSCFKVCCTNPQ